MLKTMVFKLFDYDQVFFRHGTKLRLQSKRSEKSINHHNVEFPITWGTMLLRTSL